MKTITKHNVNNERIKRKYFIYLKQAKGQHEASIDSVANALTRFESYNNSKDFKAFHFEQAIAFKRHLATQKNSKTGESLSLATINSTTRHLKNFIQWLSRETGYKSRINYSDAEYFNISEKEMRTAKAKRERPVATLEQIKHVLKEMPCITPIERRNQALIAFTALTGARDSAIASMKLKHIDMGAGAVYQDAREVNTKFSKTFTTYFFPVGPEINKVFCDWVEFLKVECGFRGDDPLFPKTLMGQGDDMNFTVVGLSREHWSNASPIRKVFKEAFSLAGLPSFNPHSFRNTLTKLGQTICQTPEEFKAWSQNLGHEGVLTTFLIYGEVQGGRQKEIFGQLQQPRNKVLNPDVQKLARALMEEIRMQGNG